MTIGVDVGPFRGHALSLIEEALFAKSFHGDNGRPNKSVGPLVSVLGLQEVFDLTDREALKPAEWNTA